MEFMLVLMVLLKIHVAESFVIMMEVFALSELHSSPTALTYYMQAWMGNVINTSIDTIGAGRAVAPPFFELKLWQNGQLQHLMFVITTTPVKRCAGDGRTMINELSQLYHLCGARSRSPQLIVLHKFSSLHMEIIYTFSSTMQNLPIISVVRSEGQSWQTC